MTPWQSSSAPWPPRRAKRTVRAFRLRKHRILEHMRRVVVSGIGLVTPVGSGRQTFWEALLAGRSGIGPVTSFDTSEFPVHIGAEVKDFAPEPYVRRQPVENLGR